MRKKNEIDYKLTFLDVDIYTKIEFIAKNKNLFFNKKNVWKKK